MAWLSFNCLQGCGCSLSSCYGSIAWLRFQRSFCRSYVKKDCPFLPCMSSENKLDLAAQNDGPLFVTYHKGGNAELPQKKLYSNVIFLDKKDSRSSENKLDEINMATTTTDRYRGGNAELPQKKLYDNGIFLDKKDYRSSGNKLDEINIATISTDGYRGGNAELLQKKLYCNGILLDKKDHRSSENKLDEISIATTTTTDGYRGGNAELPQKKLYGSGIFFDKKDYRSSENKLDEINIATTSTDGYRGCNAELPQKKLYGSGIFLDMKDYKKALHVQPSDQKIPGMVGRSWFPYIDCFRTKSRTFTSAEIVEMLSPFIFEERKEKIRRVVANRTYSICPVVEGLSDLGNISAVFRSSDALGFQSVHVISNDTTKRYKKSRNISMGSEKWLDVELWDSTCVCLETLQRCGYRIAVTHISDDTVPILDIDWSIPTAVLFGNEHGGASDSAIKMSDLRCSIPMDGMVESFNVSVAAGILLYHAAHDRIARLGKHGDLSPEEQHILEAIFYLRHSSDMPAILDHLDKRLTTAKVVL